MCPREPGELPVLSANPKLLTRCGIAYLPRGVVKKTGWKQ
jgi:hypothetical protein